MARDGLLVCGGKLIPLKALFSAFRALKIFVRLSRDGWRLLKPVNEVEEAGLYFVHGGQSASFTQCSGSGNAKLLTAIQNLRSAWVGRGRPQLCDYKGSIGEVYRDFVVNALMRTRCSNILRLSRSQGKINSPSWVVAWSVDSEGPSWLDRIWASHLLYERDRSGPWQSTGSSKAATNFDQSRKTTRSFWAHLRFYSLPSTLAYDQSRYEIDFKILEDWERAIWVFVAKVGYISGKSLLDAYWKTVILQSRLRSL